MSIFSRLHSALKDLPVTEVADAVAQSVLDGKATVLSSETGSGKTLFATTVLADAIPEEEQVVVLVPRSFLATNAAETVAGLSGLELGKEVGFAIGRLGGESRKSPDTKLLFATYGYALASGLINRAKTIVLDEVHEADIDTSISRAVLHNRMQQGESLRILEMSATIDVDKQASYWADVVGTSIHQAEGRTFPCEKFHELPGERSIADVAIDLITHYNRKGIAIFMEGKTECLKMMKDIRHAQTRILQKARDEAMRQIKRDRITDEGIIRSRIARAERNTGVKYIDINTIYGEMGQEERRKAVEPSPYGNPKILIGTNVIESGVNIPWLDAGISNGYGKVNQYHDSGAKELVTTDLPQWRLVQQEGRVKRFQPGIFVLQSDTGFTQRVEQTEPEITRAPLEELVMHCARFHLNPFDLKYDATFDETRLQSAVTRLQQLGLIDEQRQLTEAGEYVSDLPVGYQAGTMLWHAKQIGILRDVLPLAATVESDGLRADSGHGHNMDRESDIIDGLMAYRQLRGSTDEEQSALLEQLNVSQKRYNDVSRLVRDLSKRRGNRKALHHSRTASQEELLEVILAGSVDKLFFGEGIYQNMASAEDLLYRTSSILIHPNYEGFLTGKLRKTTSKSGKSSTSIEQVSCIPEHIVLKFAAEHGGLFNSPVFNHNAHGQDSVIFQYLEGSNIAFWITDPPSEAMSKLIEPAYSQFKNKNTDSLAGDSAATFTVPAAATGSATDSGAAALGMRLEKFITDRGMVPNDIKGRAERQGKLYHLLKGHNSIHLYDDDIYRLFTTIWSPTTNFSTAEVEDIRNFLVKVDPSIVKGAEGEEQLEGWLTEQIKTKNWLHVVFPPFSKDWLNAQPERGRRNALFRACIAFESVSHREFATGLGIARGVVDSWAKEPGNGGVYFEHSSLGGIIAALKPSRAEFAEQGGLAEYPEHMQLYAINMQRLILDVVPELATPKGETFIEHHMESGWGASSFLTTTIPSLFLLALPEERQAGWLLQDLMKAQGLSPRALSTILHYDPQHIRDMEAGIATVDLSKHEPDVIIEALNLFDDRSRNAGSSTDKRYPYSEFEKIMERSREARREEDEQKNAQAALVEQQRIDHTSTTKNVQKEKAAQEATTELNESGDRLPLRKILVLIRQELRLNQSELGERLGVSYGTISGLERDRPVSSERIMAYGELASTRYAILAAAYKRETGIDLTDYNPVSVSGTLTDVTVSHPRTEGRGGGSVPVSGKQ